MYRLYKIIMMLINWGVSIAIFCMGLFGTVLIISLFNEKLAEGWGFPIGLAGGLVLAILYNRWRAARINKGYERMARKAGLEPGYSIVAHFGDGEQVFMIDIKNRKVFIVQGNKQTVLPFSDITDYAIAHFDWRNIDGNYVDRYYLSIKTNSFETPEHKITLGSNRAACVEPYEKLRAALAGA